MKNGALVFVLTLILFATGTSAVGYSLASESYNSARPKKTPYKIVETKNIPWYCTSITAKIKAQFAESPRSGYYTPGYVAPGYQPAKPGYANLPGYQPSKPGYLAPTEPEKPAALVNMPAKLQPGDFARNWQTGLLPCPVSHKLDEEILVKKCSLALQKKLDGNPLPAESREQYQTCSQIIVPSVWNAKISQKICSAFYLYENDCTSSQAAKRACVPLSKYLTTAGVDRAAIPKTQSDTIYLCKNVYPKP